jgi:hypothetical protein
METIHVSISNWRKNKQIFIYIHIYTHRHTMVHHSEKELNYNMCKHMNEFWIHPKRNNAETKWHILYDYMSPLIILIYLECN